MLRSELRQFVRDLTLVEEHTASDTLIDTFLQEGYYKVLTRNKWSWLVHETDQFTPTASPFDLATLTATPLAVRDLSPVDSLELPLTQVTRGQVNFFRHSPLTGRTRLYYVEGHNLFMDPPPDGGVTYEISYFADPGWVDDSECPVPVEFQTSTVGNYATHRVWEREEDFDRSDAYLGRFEMGVADLEFVENTRNADSPKIFGEIAGHRGRNHMPWLDRVG
jgi:hypothetical protein